MRWGYRLVSFRGVAGLALSLAAGCSGDGSQTASITTTAGSPLQIRPGGPLPELTEVQRALFLAGEALFRAEQTPRQGLGPVFIERSCASCHDLGGLGGADALEDPNHFVQRFATTNADGSYNNLAALGGDVLQTRSIAAEISGCTLEPEQIPAEATIHALRNPLPMFGIGLIAAIPDATILAGAIDRGDGVHGRPNLGPTGRPGRFGWKAQTEDLAPFNAAAANGTMGITSSFSPGEQRPQGQAVPAGCDGAATGAPSPNDADGSFIGLITAWEVMLAPVSAKPIHGAAARGQELFSSIGCAKCHLPEIQSGSFELTLPDGSRLAIPQVGDRAVPLYSDLLLHDMGSELDEQVTMRQARGSDFRTAPLWGLRLRTHYLHDGRATTLGAAIAAHGGEAEIIRDRYLALSAAEQRALIKFLRRL